MGSTSAHPRIGVIIAAGGTGSRLGRPDGKQLAIVAGRPVVAWSVSALLEVRGVEAVALVCDPKQADEFSSAVLLPLNPGVPVTLVGGGATRQDSVSAGLAALPASCEIIVVHDGARPLVTTALAESAVCALLEDERTDGVVVGYPTVDTLKIVDEERCVVSTPDRTMFWAVQTPQVFRAAAIRYAHESAAEHGWLGTDDASLVERAGGRVVLVEGPRGNIKVTHAEDLVLAQALLRARTGRAE